MPDPLRFVMPGFNRFLAAIRQCACLGATLIVTGCSFPSEGTEATPQRAESTSPDKDNGNLEIAHGVEVTDLGAGLLSFQIDGTQLVGDTHYIVSRRMVPATIVGYNVDERRIVLNKDVYFNGTPATGGRAMATVGDDLYIAMDLEDSGATLARLHIPTGAIKEVKSLFPPVRVVWDMDASPDGVLYLATSRQTNARVFEYDPATDALRDLGPFEEHPRQDARSIAATADKVYVGIGYNRIDLWAVDRETGERESILPPELSDVFWLYSLDANERWIAAGTTGPDARLAVIDRSDYSKYRLIEYEAGTVQMVHLVDDVVYFGSGAGIWRYDIAGDRVEKTTPLPANRGIFYRDGRIHGSAGATRIGWHDLTTGETEMVDLLEQGIDLGAEPAQSLAAGSGRVYFGGRSLGIRDLATGKLEAVSAPGEAKSMIVVDGSLYMAMYTSGRIVRYDPETGAVTNVAQAPEGQLRPRIIHYDELNRLLLMGTQADELGGGALTIHNLNTRKTEFYINPIGDTAVATIASSDGAIFIAAQRSDGPIGSWDPAGRDWVWKIQPPEGEWAMGLAIVDGLLYGVTDRGTLFVIDPETPQYLHQESILSGGGRLLVQDGEIFGVTGDMFYRLDRQGHKPVPLVTGLNSRWFPGWPTLAVDENGAFYVVREANVLRITIP